MTTAPLWAPDEDSEEWQGLPCCPRCHLRYGNAPASHAEECPT